MRRTSLISFLLVAMFLFSAPAWPKFGIVKTHARFAMYHPPAFHAYGRQVRLEVNSVDARTGLIMVPRIQHLMEEGLVRQNIKVAPNARTLLECALTDSTAYLEMASRSESINVHLGEHAEEQKDGTTKQVEDCRVEKAPVTYLISSGHLAMQVKATDTQTQTVLMSQLVERSYRQESPIAGPPKCRGEAYPVFRPQSHDTLFILGFLGDQAIGETLPLAVGYNEPREVLLAVDDPLKSGDAQAVAGAWRDALDNWTKVSMRSRAAEAARQYNMGVAHEVMAAIAMGNWELNDATSHFYQSQECYSQALSLDPEEKYFRDTMARLQADQRLLQQQLQQASDEESARAGAGPGKPAPAAASSLTAPVDGWPSGDSSPVHDYRVYARTRLTGQKGRPTEAFRQELVAGAAGYGVDPDNALQVVNSEAQRLSALQQNVEGYRADFQAAAADGVITADERQMLRKRRQILHISDDQAREIESRFKIQETDRGER